MADRVRLQQSVILTPTVGAAGGRATLSSEIDDSFVLTAKLPAVTYTLSADSAQAVSFGTLSEAAFVTIRVLSGSYVRARVTSTHGSAQSLPVDDTLTLKCRRNPITALDLTREPGVETVVEVTLGKQS